MNPMNNMALVAEYQRVRGMLLASFPELVDDPQALSDTLDGETGLLDAIDVLIRASRADEAMESALDGMIGEMRERKARIGSRAAKQREAALALMQAADIKKLERPDFTATVSAGRAKVTIADESLIPSQFTRTKVEPDKTAIKAALDAGLVVAGAVLGNVEPILTIRTR